MIQEYERERGRNRDDLESFQEIQIKPNFDLERQIYYQFQNPNCYLPNLQCHI